MSYGSEFSFEVLYISFFLATLMTLLNAFFNPIIYAARLREFRVAFIEYICRTRNIAEAEQIESQLSGAVNAVVRTEAGQECNGQAQHNVEQENMNNNDYVNNNDVIARELSRQTAYSGTPFQGTPSGPRQVSLE